MMLYLQPKKNYGLIYIFKILKTNDLLNKYGLFLRVYKLKEICYLIKQDSEKKTVLRELCSCTFEKFNEFNIVSIEFCKKLRQSFRPVDIIHKPVKK